MSIIFAGNPTSRQVFTDLRIHNSNNVITNRIPFYTTANLPPPTFPNKGQIVYDITLNQFCYCNGIAWVCIGGGSASTAGIVDCTVGNVANPNADYNSVQAALDAGCLNIRLLDGFTGGQVPGYFEPGPIAFSAVGSPVMIYITPGVDWELRQSVVGTGGIDMTGSVVTFLGSGFGSIIRQIQDGGVAASVFAMSDGTLSQWSDLTFVTSAAASAFPNPMGRFLMINCQYVVVDTNAGTAYSINTVGNSAENRVEFHECTFIAVDDTTRMLDNSSGGNNGFLTLTNCVHEGAGLTPVTDSVYRFATVGGHVTVNGFELHNTLDISLTLGGPDGSSFDGIYQSGVALVTVIMAGTAHLNNGRFDTMVFASGGNNIANVTITGAVGVDVTTADNHLDDVYLLAGPLTLSGGTNTVEGGSATSLFLTSTDNRVSNFTATSAVVSTVTAGSNTLTNCTMTAAASLTVTGPTNIFSACRLPSLTLSSANNKVIGCLIAGAMVISPGTDENQVAGTQITGTLTVDGEEHMISGNVDVGGATALGTLAASPNNTITGSNLTGGLVVGGGGTTEGTSITGCVIQSSTTLSGDNCTFGDNNITGAGTLTITGGTTAAGGNSVSNCTVGHTLSVSGVASIAGTTFSGTGGVAVNTILGTVTGTASFITVDNCRFIGNDVTCDSGNWRLSNCVLQGSDLNFTPGGLGACSEIQILNNRIVAGSGNTGSITSAINDASMNRIHIEGNILDGVITQTDGTAGERSGCIFSNNTIRNTGNGANSFVYFKNATNVATTVGYKVDNNNFLSGNMAFQNASASTPLVRNLEIGGNRMDTGRIDVFDAVANATLIVDGVDIHDNIVENNTATAIAVDSVILDTAVKVSNNIVGTDFSGAGAAGVVLPVGGAGAARSVAVGNILGGGAFVAAAEVAAGNLLT